MVGDDYAPARGDVVWIDMNPQLGREQAGRRPAVILSPLSYNRKVGLALLCPITNHEKGYPFEVPIPEGLPVSGVVLADQVKSLDWRARRVEKAFSLSPDLFARILRKAQLLLS